MIRALIAVLAVVAAITTDAADRFSSGGKTWDTATTNWGSVTTGPYDTETWSSEPPDSAIFEGVAGTVTLTESITNSGIRFDVTGYTITNIATETISVTAGSTFRCDVAAAVITPDVDFPEATVTLSGTGTGILSGYISAPGGAYGNAHLVKEGAGTWVINGGCPDTYQFGAGIDVNGGILKANAYISVGHTDQVRVNSGGEFHWNAPDVVDNPGGNSNVLKLNGGKLDNSSGAPVVCVAGSGFNLAEDSTFIGSQGTNSDLTLKVIGSWADGKTLTVSNSEATLTLVADHSYSFNAGSGAGIIKGGAGTLCITGDYFNYVGDTTVEDGTLRIQRPYMDPDSYAYITNSGVLDLDFVGTNTIARLITNGVTLAGGIYGAPGAGAPNEIAALAGSGRLKVTYATVLEGIRYWDGGSSDIGAPGDQVGAGGSGTWNTSIKNWDCGATIAHTNWNNASNDVAYIRGTPGTITLAEDITLGGIELDADAEGYVITNSTLNFTANSTFDVHDGVTVYSDIAGNPVFDTSVDSGGQSVTLDASSMMLGGIRGGSTDYFYLKGDGSSSVTGTISGVRTYKSGPGTWTVKNIIIDRNLVVDDGVLKVTGTVNPGRHDLAPALQLNGGEFHCNSTNTFDATDATSSKKLDINLVGGWLDNSAGYPITLNMKDDDVQVNVSGDFGFIGSGGAASDLNLGTRGVVVLKNGDRTITVSNAATELTVPIPIGDGGNGLGLTKAGDGTLKLTGANTYSGDTHVSGGQLWLGAAAELADSSTLFLTNSGSVYLDTGYATSISNLYFNAELMWTGTWGSNVSTAKFKDSVRFDGSGILNVIHGSFPPSGTVLIIK